MHLLDRRLRRTELGTISGGLHRGLFLGVPVNGRLVDEMQDAGDCSPRGHIVIEVGILVSRSAHTLAFWFWSVLQQRFLHVPVDRSSPVLIIFRESRVIRLLHSNPDAPFAEADQVSTNSSETGQVSRSWCNSES